MVTVLVLRCNMSNSHTVNHMVSRNINNSTPHRRTHHTNKNLNMTRAGIILLHMDINRLKPSAVNIPLIRHSA